MNITFLDLYYTVIKNWNDNEDIVDKYGKNEIDYIIFNEFISPNHYNGMRNNSSILR